MKVLLDANLPSTLCKALTQAGWQCRHVRHLPKGLKSSDLEIAGHADREREVVVTKDIDLLDLHLALGRPRKLLLIRFGNVSNVKLAELMFASLSKISTAFESSNLVELVSPDQI